MARRWHEPSFRTKDAILWATRFTMTSMDMESRSSELAEVLLWRRGTVAAGLFITIDPLAVREPDDFDSALAGMDRRPPDALVMVASGFAPTS